MNPVDWLRQLNTLCDDFEGSWRSGTAPSLESVLQQVEPKRRSELLRELLGLELAYRHKRGEFPNQAEFLSRFPSDASVVAEVFSTNPSHAGQRESVRLEVNGEPADSSEMSWHTTRHDGRTDRHRKYSVLPVNTRIGHFELLEEIGRGGMGVVFKARQLNLPREVALKMILSGEFADRHEIERFRAEAEAAAGLRHPNIVPLYEVGEEGGRHFFAMALIKGRDLHEALREGPLPARAGARLIQRIAEAVHYAHTRGIIHRDLKPGNILLDENGEPHVTDFGLARRSDVEGRLTETGQILGTVGFISPEQIRDRADRIGPATDIYALGALLYKCLTGSPPCQAADPIEALRQSVEDPPVSLRLLGQGIPRDLETVCLKCLEKEPARRYGSARDLADDLGRHLRGEPIRARPIGRVNRTWRWCRRRPALAGLLGGAVAGVVLVATILVVHNRNLERLNAQLIIKADEARSHQEAAERERQRATDSEQQARNMLAASSVRLAAEALQQQDYRTARELLDRVLPAPGRPDQRDFGWWYLHGQLDREHRDLLRLDSAVYFIGRSPDGKRIVAVGKDAVARLIDIESGTSIAEIPTGQIEVNGAAFSPDGRELATTGDDGSIQFHSLDTYQRRLCIDHAFPRQVFQPVYSPDGSQLICCGNDPVIRQFETRTGRLTAEFRGHTDTVQSLVLFSGGTRLASSSDDRRVKLWDTASQVPFGSFAFDEPASAIELDPDRNLIIAASGDHTIRTFSVDPPRELSCRRHLDGIAALALNRDRNLVAAGDRSGGIRLWSVTGNGELAENPIAAWNAHQGEVSSLLWNVEGSRLISAGRDGRVVSWSLAGATDQRIRRFPVGTKGTNVFCLIPQSSRLVTAGHDPQGLELYDWKNGTRERVLDEGRYIHVRGSWSGRLLAAIKTMKDAKGDELRVFRFDSDWETLLGEAGITRWYSPDIRSDLTFAGDGKSLALITSINAAEGDQSIPTVGLLRLGGSAGPTLLPISEARHLEFVPGTNHLVIITDRSLILWDVTQEKPIWSIDQPEDECVQVSADGSLIATGGIRRVITVRNAADGSLCYQLNGHRSRILFLAFSPDKQTLASAGFNGVIKLWHVKTGEALFDLTEPGGEYRQVEFTADGQHLLGLHHTEQQDEIVIFRREDDVSTRHN